MAFNQIWEQVHYEKEWGAYPAEDLVRWAFRTFGKDKASHNELHILDLGCGQGNNTWFLAREGFHVFAVDGSVSAVRKTIRKLIDEALALRVVGASMDFARLTCRDAIFDAVIDVVSSCHNSIHELPDIYAEMARVLKPGGKLFMMCPTFNSDPEPFLQYGTVSFVCELDLRLLLQPWFDIVELTKSSYQPNQTCRVEHWVVSAVKR